VARKLGRKPSQHTTRHLRRFLVGGDFGKTAAVPARLRRPGAVSLPSGQLRRNFEPTWAAASALNWIVPKNRQWTDGGLDSIHRRPLDHTGICLSPREAEQKPLSLGGWRSARRSPGCVAGSGLALGDWSWLYSAAGAGNMRRNSPRARRLYSLGVEIGCFNAPAFDWPRKPPDSIRRFAPLCPTGGAGDPVVVGLGDSLRAASVLAWLEPAAWAPRQRWPMSGLQPPPRPPPPPQARPLVRSLRGRSYVEV